MSTKHTAFPKEKKTEDLDPSTRARDDINRVLEKLREFKPSKHRDDREFDPDFLQVYLDNAFMATIAMKVNRQADNEMPTAYVGVQRAEKELAFVLGYNEKFFRSLNAEQRRGVIQHEFYHLVFNHITERNVEDKQLAKLWNIATDLAINSILGKKRLPRMCLIPQERPINSKTGAPETSKVADYIANAKPMQAADTYFIELKEVLKEELSKGEAAMEIAIGDVGEMDDHSGWGNLPPELAEQVREQIREMVSDAVKNADRTNSWGSVPSAMQDYIRSLISREVDWRSIVKNFIGRCRSPERNSTIKRINKKVPYAHPGVKRKTVATFACFVDQSGSVCDSDLELFFGELGSFSKEAELDVFHFDTEVDEKSHTVWRKGAKTPTRLRTRCGGTDFNAVANFVNTKANRGRWTGVVILTDGYAPKLGHVHAARVLWVITETGDAKSAVRSGDLVCQMKREKQFKRQ